MTPRASSPITSGTHTPAFGSSPVITISSPRSAIHARIPRLTRTGSRSRGTRPRIPAPAAGDVAGDDERGEQHAPRGLSRDRYLLDAALREPGRDVVDDHGRSRLEHELTEALDRDGRVGEADGALDAVAVFGGPVDEVV